MIPFPYGSITMETEYRAAFVGSPPGEGFYYAESTADESYSIFRAFLLLYAFGFSGRRVTGFTSQMLRRCALSSLFFFLESLSYGMNFSISTPPVNLTRA